MIYDDKLQTIKCLSSISLTAAYIPISPSKIMKTWTNARESHFKHNGITRKIHPHLSVALTKNSRKEYMKTMSYLPDQSRKHPKRKFTRMYAIPVKVTWKVGWTQTAYVFLVIGSEKNSECANKHTLSPSAKVFGANLTFNQVTNAQEYSCNQ